MISTNPKLERLVDEFWIPFCEEFGRLRQQRLNAFTGCLVDFLNDLLNYPLVRPWRESLDLFQAHYWQQIGLQLTSESYQELAALIEREVNDPTCFAHGPIQPDIPGQPPRRPPGGLVGNPKSEHPLDIPEGEQENMRRFAHRVAELEQKRIALTDEEVAIFEAYLYENIRRQYSGERAIKHPEFWHARNDAFNRKLRGPAPTRDEAPKQELTKTAESKSPQTPQGHVVSVAPNVSGPAESGKAPVQDGTTDSAPTAPTDKTNGGVESSPPIEKDTAFKPHPLNGNVSYWVPLDSGLTEADVIRAFQIAAVVRAVRRLIAQMREEQDHPGILRQLNDALNPFADPFNRNLDEISNLWDLEVLLFELEAEWIIKGYDRIQWLVFGIPARAGLDFAESIVTSGPPHALQEVTVEALLNVAGTAALLKLGVALLARGGMQLLASKSAVIRILPKEEGSVWDLGWGLRGQKIEQKLGHNVPSGYPRIDRWIPGGATSIKSMDLRAATYAEPDAILRIGGKYVDELLEFSGSGHGGLVIQPGEIRSRTLRLAVPPQMTETQQIALQTLIEYAQGKGVLVEIKRVF
jgi:hypothetical protein